jgi:tetratricopeptide (TPR) repeat protein
MHCPRCKAVPPRDPFVCSTCGERLLTYLGEPLGPGTGIARSRHTTNNRNDLGHTRGGPVATLDRPVGGPPHAGQQPRAPRPGQSSDNAGLLVAKLLFGSLLALIVLALWPLGGLLMLGALAFLIWRWPRLTILPFTGTAIVIAVMIWMIGALVGARGLVDELTGPSVRPTPTVQRTFATPTLVPTARAATPPVRATPQAAAATDSQIWLARARSRWLRGDNKAALEDVNRALTQAPGDADVLNMRSLIQSAAGDYANAAVDANVAIQARPNVNTYHDTRAYAWLKMGRYSDAVDEYGTALTGMSGDDRAASLLGRGLALTALKRPEGRTELEAGLRLLPDIAPDPQLADLEASARYALDPSAPRPGAAPSPVAVPSPSPIARYDTGARSGRAQ